MNRSQSIIPERKSETSDQQSAISNRKSTISDSPWLHCPVCHDTRRITSLSKDMVRAMRKLRRDLKACQSCSIDMADCPILQNLSSQIQAAIQEVTKELDLKL